MRLETEETRQGCGLAADENPANCGELESPWQLIVNTAVLKITTGCPVRSMRLPLAAPDWHPISLDTCLFIFNLAHWPFCFFLFYVSALNNKSAESWEGRGGEGGGGGINSHTDRSKQMRWRALEWRYKHGIIFKLAFDIGLMAGIDCCNVRYFRASGISVKSAGKCRPVPTRARGTGFK